MKINRRHFLHLGAGATIGLAITPALHPLLGAAEPEKAPFKISLAEWSLNKTLRAGKMTNLDFPRVAKKDFGIDCIEFVDQFFQDKAKDESVLALRDWILENFADSR